jgi:hypothetical protein
MKVWQVVSVVALSSVLAGGARSHAAEQLDPEALKAAKELCAVVTKDSLKQISAQMSSMVWPGIEESLKAKQTITAKQLDSLRQDFERIQVDLVSNVMEEAPVVYARHFTAAELREMLAFYRTPVGQKSLSVLPQVMSEIMALVMPKLPKLQKDVMESFEKVLRKRGLEI